MSDAASPWRVGARSETGYVRTANEDRMGWTPTAYGDVFVVSDGMGGYRGGALAAEITVQTLQQRLAAISPGETDFAGQVRQAFGEANAEVYRQRRPDDPERREMGATAVALVSRGARAMVGHVGDSRAYLWRRRGGLRQLTRDHTRVQAMIDAGLLTPQQAATHPEASVLDRAIGHQPEVQADVSDWIALQRDDRLLLCSDGLSGYVADEEIEAVLRAEGDARAATDRLIGLALDKGGHDNVTVQLLRFAPSRAGVLGHALGRPALLVPLSVGITAVAATLIGLRATESYRAEIALLRGRPDARAGAGATVPAGAAASAGAASSAHAASSGAAAPPGRAASAGTAASIPGATALAASQAVPGRAAPRAATADGQQSSASPSPPPPAGRGAREAGRASAPAGTHAPPAAGPARRQGRAGASASDGRAAAASAPRAAPPAAPRTVPPAARPSKPPPAPPAAAPARPQAPQPAAPQASTAPAPAPNAPPQPGAAAAARPEDGRDAHPQTP